MNERVQAIRSRLESQLHPSELEVTDDSHQHVGHAGARDGRGHFSVRIVSTTFEGMPALARHRAVYAALEELMKTDIHALAIDARSAEETR